MNEKNETKTMKKIGRLKTDTAEMGLDSKHLNTATNLHE